MRNYYEILNVSPDADYGQIRSAYRKMAKQYHPDIVDNHIGDFCLVKEAFDTLSDAGKRRSYDRSIGLHKPLSNTYRSDRVNVPPQVQDVYDDLLDVVSDRFNLPRKRRLSIDLYLSDREFAEGAQTSISIPQEKICPSCFGFGGTLVSTCRSCNGSGTVEFNVDFDLILKPPLYPGQLYEVKRGKHMIQFRLKRGENIG